MLVSRFEWSVKLPCIELTWALNSISFVSCSPYIKLMWALNSISFAAIVAIIPSIFSFNTYIISFLKAIRMSLLPPSPETMMLLSMTCTWSEQPHGNLTTISRQSHGNLMATSLVYKWRCCGSSSLNVVLVCLKEVLVVLRSWFNWVLIFESCFKLAYSNFNYLQLRNTCLLYINWKNPFEHLLLTSY